MTNRILRVFGSYDIIGKAIPGAVFMLGIVSFLPGEDIPSLAQHTFVNIAALTLILLIGGLMIGQSVHTIADNIEKTFNWFAYRFINLLNYIRALLNLDLQLSTVKYGNAKNEKGLTARVIINWWDNSIEWVRRRYWGTYDSLAPHRWLFAKYIEWNFNSNKSRDSKYSGRWKEGKKGKLYEGFADTYEDEFNEDIRKLDPSDIKDRYPIITSSLNDAENGNFRHFQAIYSFCRSMWVVFVIFSISYGDIIYTNYLFGSRIVTEDPAIFKIFSDSFLQWLPGLLLIIAVSFFDAAGTYKRHYIEYLFADYYISKK